MKMIFSLVNNDAEGVREMTENEVFVESILNEYSNIFGGEREAKLALKQLLIDIIIKRIEDVFGKNLEEYPITLLVNSVDNYISNNNGIAVNLYFVLNMLDTVDEKEEGESKETFLKNIENFKAYSRGNISFSEENAKEVYAFVSRDFTEKECAKLNSICFSLLLLIEEWLQDEALCDLGFKR